MNAEISEFLVQKLKLKILPAIYYFEEGKVKDKMIGFEEFGNKDDFGIASLKVRLG